MKKLNYKRLECILFWGLSGITILWFFFFINKGIDVTDMAYYCTKYKYYFASGSDVKNPGTFLTELLGAGIYHLSDTGQVFILSLCSWGLYMGSGLMAYRCLKHYIHRVLLLVAIFAGSLFSLTWVHVMNYNATSMFMLTAGICILIKAMEKDKFLYCIFAGFILGLNTFFRLPNILQICTGASILWYFIFCKNEWKKGIQRFSGYVLGVVGGWTLGGGLAFLILGKESILSYLFKTANTAVDSQDDHGIRTMIMSVYGGVKQGIKDWIYYGILILAILAVWNLLIRKKQELSKKDFVLYIGLCCITGLYGINVGWRLENFQFYQMIGVCILGIMLAGIFYYRKSHSLLSAICAAGFCAEMILCIGTDNGWGYQVVFLIFPLCVCIGEVYNCQDILLRRNLIICTIFVAAIYFVVGFRYATQYVYMDAPNSELRYSVDAEEYRGIYTSRERAEYLDELTQVLDSFEDKELLAFGHFNIGYVISDLPPCVGHVWIDLESYPLETFKKDLEEGIERKGYPVILIMNMDQTKLYSNTNKLEIIEKVLQEGDYQICYENDWYCVYKPS